MRAASRACLTFDRSLLATILVSIKRGAALFQRPERRLLAAVAHICFGDGGNGSRTDSGRSLARIVSGLQPLAILRAKMFARFNSAGAVETSPIASSTRRRG